MVVGLWEELIVTVGDCKQGNGDGKWGLLMPWRMEKED